MLVYGRIPDLQLSQVPLAVTRLDPFQDRSSCSWPCSASVSGFLCPWSQTQIEVFPLFSTPVLVPIWNARIQDTIGSEQSYILSSRCPWRWCCKMEFWDFINAQALLPTTTHRRRMLSQGSVDSATAAYPAAASWPRSGLRMVTAVAGGKGEAQKSVSVIPRSAEEACPVP